MTAPKLRRLVARRRTRSPDGAMPLREHIAELRSRLIKALLFVALGMIVGWVFYPHILDILKEPYCALPPDRRFPPDRTPGQCQLLFFGPLDGFMLRFKVAGIAGVVLSAPFWLYQLWAFVTPGLRRNERRWTITFVLTSTVLFAAGAFLSYLTVSKALNLLVSVAGNGVVSAIEVTRYLGFVMTMLLVFGASFELPVLVVLLNFVGVLSFRRLMKWQRMAIFLIFVFAAIATPSQDPLSMCMLAVPMCLLFEGAVLVAFVHDRRKERRRAAESFHDLPDDVASPLDARPSPVDGPSPLDEVDAGR
jgi:sec-independent protein translocase protein TatC